MNNYSNNPLIHPRMGGSVGNWEDYQKEESERVRRFKEDPRYSQWGKEAQEYEKELKRKAGQARREYLARLPAEISKLESYMLGAIKILHRTDLKDETKMEKAIKKLKDSGYLYGEDE